MEHASQLAGFMKRQGGRGIVVLTGAGCSTESGIPDYRGPHGRYRREDFVPLMFQKFMRSEDEMRRYWVRSMFGYTIMSGASCNLTHMGLHALWQANVVSHIITQNVDGLHHLAAHGGVGDSSAAGITKYMSSTTDLYEIHGNIHRVICMRCGALSSRAHLQEQLCEANPGLWERFRVDGARARPDGDFSVPKEAVSSMNLVMCAECGGYLKPHVVLFGENVPTATVVATREVATSASALICLGTSLQVFSAYRYVLSAVEKDVPVAVVNAGKTRADNDVTLKIDTTSTAAIISEVVGLMNL